MIVFVWVDGMDGIVGNDFLCGWVAVGHKLLRQTDGYQNFCQIFEVLQGRFVPD